MVTLLIIHVIQFLFIRELMYIKPRNQENSNDNFQIAEDLEGPVDKQFNYKNWWFWIVSGLVELAVLITFIFTNGYELYFIFWIPTDFMLFVGMFFYYCLTAYFYERVHNIEVKLQVEIK